MGLGTLLQLHFRWPAIGAGVSMRGGWGATFWVKSCLNKKKEPDSLFESGSSLSFAGSDLLSHTVTRAVPLALEVLTSEFGMGSGVAPPPSPPANRLEASKQKRSVCRSRGLVKPLG